MGVQTKENENGVGKRPDATHRLGVTRNKLMTVSRQWFATRQKAMHNLKPSPRNFEQMLWVVWIDKSANS